jgi:serine/threonine protein kinase
LQKHAAVDAKRDPNVKKGGECAVGGSAGHRRASCGQAATPVVAKESERAMMPEIPGYEIQGELGRGGMGVVYKCTQQATGADVALKLLLHGRGASREALARFRVEAEALACLDHPNITRILDIGVAAGCPYFAAEYAPHGTIDRFLAGRHKGIDWLVDAIRQIALAVDHANRRWMIHRDIKPSNILVFDGEVPKITDFGLVKFTTRVQWVAAASRMPGVDQSFARFDEFLAGLSRELAFQYRACRAGDPLSKFKDACLERTGLPSNTIDLATVERFVEETSSWNGAEDFDDLAPAAGQLDMLTVPDCVLGSPHFMSPEQAKGELDKIGPPTDVYGLGATLYWLLTGEPVFSGRSLGELLDKIGRDSEFPIPARDRNADVSVAVDCVVWKAIQKHASRRYERCALLAEELQACLSGAKPRAQLSRERQLKLNAEADTKVLQDREKYADLFKRAFPPQG